MKQKTGPQKHFSEFHFFFTFKYFHNSLLHILLGNLAGIVVKHCDSHLCNHCTQAEFHSSKPDSKDFSEYKNFIAITLLYNGYITTVKIYNKELKIYNTMQAKTKLKFANSSLSIFFVITVCQLAHNF